MVRVGFIMVATAATAAALSLYVWNYTKITNQNKLCSRLQHWAEGSGDALTEGWTCVVDLTSGQVSECTGPSPWKNGLDISHMVNENGTSILKKIQQRTPSGGGRFTINAPLNDRLASHQCYAVSKENNRAVITGIVTNS